jgi:hypothetical protein
MYRGIYAKKSTVAWNQPADDEWLYNTSRPLRSVKFWLKRLVFFDPLGDGAYLPLVEWVERMEKLRDWREVAEEKLAELETIAARFILMARWHMGESDSTKSIRPVGDTEPIARAAVTFVRGAADIVKCTTIARRRIEETRTLGARRMMETRAIADALDPIEAARTLTEWKKSNSGRKEPVIS